MEFAACTRSFNQRVVNTQSSVKCFRVTVFVVHLLTRESVAARFHPHSAFFKLILAGLLFFKLILASLLTARGLVAILLTRESVAARFHPHSASVKLILADLLTARGLVAIFTHNTKTSKKCVRVTVFVVHTPTLESGAALCNPHSAFVKLILALHR